MQLIDVLPKESSLSDELINILETQCSIKESDGEYFLIAKQLESFKKMFETCLGQKILLTEPLEIFFEDGIIHDNNKNCSHYESFILNSGTGQLTFIETKKSNNIHLPFFSDWHYRIEYYTEHIYGYM